MLPSNSTLASVRMPTAVTIANITVAAPPTTGPGSAGDDRAHLRDQPEEQQEDAAA